MTTPHPLNQAVIAQALQDLRNGQLRRCKAMGFGEQEMEALKHPALLSLLINASVTWCTVRVNRDIIRHLLQQVQDIEQEVTLIDRMLRLNASTEMVCHFHGLTHQEVALRRDVLGLPKRKGRHPVLSEEQDVQLWEYWKAERDKRGVDKQDERALLMLTLDIAEQLNLPASVIWLMTQSWIKQNLA
ncbi:DUF2857 domain-containing protein [Klebsiella pneumoniae]